MTILSQFAVLLLYVTSKPTIPAPKGDKEKVFCLKQFVIC